MIITYRSVITAIVGVILAVCIVLYLLFPGSRAARAINALGISVLERVGITHSSGKAIQTGPQQAHFTNLDGSVRIKKANSNTWVPADYSIPLEKGDVVQTGSEGMAKIVFADGTSYAIKQDSLIVVEENSTNASLQTQVSVQVTTGTVDLSTATYSQGSRSQVIVAGATASLSPESSAMVHNDPRADRHEILLKKGSGLVSRNNETVMLSDFERVSFRAQSPKMEKDKQIRPPTLISPAHLMPVFNDNPARPVEFSWTPVLSSHGYHLRISRNPYFSSTVFDSVVREAQIKIPGLKEGTYYWQVLSRDANGKDSVESEQNQFTLLARAPDVMATMPLELSPFVQHGQVIEVKGKTEAAARVMVNGQEVPFIRDDGSFNYFTPPLPRGENIITVTAQNTKGGVRTQQRKIVID